MKKRLICTILSILMLVSLLPMGVAAEEGDTPTEETTTSATESTTPEETEATISDDAAAVQALIDALPTADEVAAMDTDGQNEVYMQASDIWDAYHSLTDEEQTQVDISSLEALAEYFNGLISVATDTFQIGDTIYASWGDAIAAAGDGDTIILLRTVTYSSTSVLTVTEGKNVTLDLNGYTLSKTYSGTSTSSLITNNGTLTIIDSSAAQTGTISVIASNTSAISSAGVFLAAIRNAGTLILESGTIKASTKSTSSRMSLWCVVNTASGASTTQNGASVVVEKTSTYYSSYGIYNNADNTSIFINSGSVSVSSPASASTAAVGTNTSCSSSSITMNGGTLEVNCTREGNIATAYYGILAESGSTTVTGGAITVSSMGGAYGIKANKDNLAEISNLTMSVSTTTTSSSLSYYLASYANITSGTYTMADATNLSAAFGEGVTIYGGTYSENLNSENYLAEGCSVTENEDGTYTVNASAFTLGIYGNESTSIPADIVSGEGTATVYVKVSATYIGKKGYYSTTAYPTTSLTYTPDEGSNDSGKYIFAGWYTATVTDDTTTYTACESFPTNTDAYAKFVDANVLTVKTQITAGTQSTDNSSNMRFVSSVDSLDYKEVGFLIQIANGTVHTISSTTVYEKVLASSSDKTVVASDPTIFSSISKYFITYAVYSIPNENFDTGISATPYWITMDGTTVYGVRVTKTVTEGINNTSSLVSAD